MVLFTVSKHLGSFHSHKFSGSFNKASASGLVSGIRGTGMIEDASESKHVMVGKAMSVKVVDGGWERPLQLELESNNPSRINTDRTWSGRTHISKHISHRSPCTPQRLLRSLNGA